jgi:hypothetical protein
MLATAGLHNKCIDRRIPLPTEDFEIDERLGDDGQHEGQQRDSNHGRRIRKWRQEYIGILDDLCK